MSATLIVIAFSWNAFVSPTVRGVDLSEATELFHQGKYEECIDVTRAEVDRGVWNDGWSRLLMRCLISKGEYATAAEVYDKVKEKFSASISLRLLAVEALRFSGKNTEARTLLLQIPALLQAAPWRFSDQENMVALGGYMLNAGEDPREVLSIFYDRTLKSDPKFTEAHLAIAELALSKNDFQEAVVALRRAEKIAPQDPRVHYLLARAWSPSDGEKARAALETALSINPRHTDSLLMRCEAVLDAEELEAAEAYIDKVLEINQRHPKAWALQAVIHHLRGEYAKEGECRRKGLSTWAQNPAVDYEIGRKLSRFYRFSDAVQYLRRAVTIDPSFMPARFQLAQDLLRLGQVDEGWTMVDQLAAADKYNVVAANLRTLRERLTSFTTLQAPGFIVRMDAREAKIYGPRVLRLLDEAKETLEAKYDFKLSEPVSVEIFPQQSDFAIRTFGLPGGAGFLGVCFGKLITANSPASQGETPSNWESVLWHEFCHVITLQKSSNRMPRWLSEGISVYEELQRDASWGQSMNPIYRQMILGKDFVPLSKLSSAFLQPKSAMHLQFAYFESSMAVRYLVERHGMERLKQLLVDLGAGIPMHEALARGYGEPEPLDNDFQEYAIAAAKRLYSEQPSEEEELSPRMPIEELAKLVAKNPRHYAASRMLVQRSMAAEKWSEALAVLERLDQAWPADAETGGTLETLAVVYRKLDRPADERATLERIIEHSSDNVAVLLRLIELAKKDGDPQRVGLLANKLLAVQPLVAAGHEALAASAVERGDGKAAAGAYVALLEMQPLDPGRLHYLLAETSFNQGDDAVAREHLLVTLEETPRYRDAQALLLQLVARRETAREAARIVADKERVFRTLDVPDEKAKPPAPTRSP